MDKTKRIESISNSIHSSWNNESIKWFTHKWRSEGDIADFLFGTNWPCIDCFYEWTSTGLSYGDGTFHSFCLKLGKDTLNSDWPKGLGYELFCDYYFISPLDTMCRRRELYAKDSIMLNLSWVDFRIATKIWAVDELNKGIDPMIISIILIELRRRELLKRNLRFYLYE